MKEIVFTLAQLLLGNTPDELRLEDPEQALKDIELWLFMNRGAGEGSEPTGRWNVASRQDVAARLTELVTKPHLLNQGTSKWCVAAAFLYVILRRYPETFVAFATGLFDDGRGTIGRMTVSANPGLVAYDFGGNRSAFFESAKMNPTDWMVMAAMFDHSRPAGNRFGGNMATHSTNDNDDLQDWFNATRLYTNVDDRYRTFAFLTGIPHAEDLKPGAARDVIMIIRMTMVQDDFEIRPSPYDEHAAVLESPVSLVGDTVEFSYWSWGLQPRKKQVSKQQFPGWYFGGVLGDQPKKQP